MGHHLVCVFFYPHKIDKQETQPWLKHKWIKKKWVIAGYSYFIFDG
jgi:hypothetical protein